MRQPRAKKPHQFAEVTRVLTVYDLLVEALGEREVIPPPRAQVELLKVAERIAARTSEEVS